MQQPDNTLNFLVDEVSEATTIKTLTMVKARQLMQLHTLQDAMDSMHKSVVLTATKARADAVARHNAQTNVQSTNFTVGDYVLVGCPNPTSKTNLL